MATPKGISTLGGLLGEICRDKGWNSRLGLYGIFGMWPEIVGPDISAHAEPVLIRGTVLHVRVTDSVWMQHLQLQKRSLLDALNRRLPEGNLSDMRFEIATGPFTQKTTKAEILHKPVDLEAEKKIDSLLGAIEDEKVRRSMKHLWLGCRED